MKVAADKLPRHEKMTKQIRYKSILCVRVIGLMRLIFATLILTLTLPAVSWTHPHLFITTYYTLVFDDNGLAGIRVYWSLDEMYSSITGDDFDKDKNGTFSVKESGALVELASENLPPFNFFTNIEIDGQSFPVKSVSDFKITYESGQLDYEFFVPCPVPTGNRSRTVKISPYDPEFSAAMLFADDQPILLENAESFKIDISIGEDQDKTIFFDMIHPVTLNLVFQQKI